MMHKTAVNPWTWQQALGYSQAVSVTGAHRTVHLAGQCSVGPDGAPLHPGSLPRQVEQALVNVEKVLAGAGMALTDVVRLDVYTTDLAAYLATGHHVVVERFGAVETPPAGGILAEVGRLALPELQVELVVTAQQ
jgi:enamine deaminase RidA (YjgF/YER057c/UK114 family)